MTWNRATLSLASLKDVGRAITDVYATIADGSYEAGQVLEYGLASGAVDVTFEAQEQVLPQSIVDHVNEVRQQIISGELVIRALYAASNLCR